jgi:FGGY-family pentulose kinase
MTEQRVTSGTIETSYVVAVDVGTGSARAGVFDLAGRQLARAERSILLRRPQPDWAEQDSSQIWEAVCEAVRDAVAASGVAPAAVGGIGFDATCSLVVRDRKGEPLPVSAGSEPQWDTIVWLDHRAKEETERCNATGHRVLDFVGGAISPEMETPKLMWLKRHVPESWARAGHFFDLADFLTWRATGSAKRSQCTLTCKWTYLPHQGGWQHDFFEAVGIPDMLERGGLPDDVSEIGADLGPLTPGAARDLGLTTACRVATGLIDAHAGMLGLLGGVAGSDDIESNVGLIAGTSTCLMALSPALRAVPGVWGPYLGAVLPGLWLNEGGQSATGALLDHIIAWHGAGGEPGPAMHRRICERIDALRRAEGDDFAAGLHVLPDFHGNRSPLADSGAVGVISGLTLDASFDSLCRLYWRSCVGIALGVRHIVEVLNAQGYRIDTLHVAGGHVNNPLLMELYADATGCDVVEPDAGDAVLLGTAMAAAKAAGNFETLTEVCLMMQGPARRRNPDTVQRARFDRDYRVFLRMHEQRRELDRLSRSM